MEIRIYFWNNEFKNLVEFGVLSMCSKYIFYLFEYEIDNGYIYILYIDFGI